MSKEAFKREPCSKNSHIAKKSRSQTKKSNGSARKSEAQILKRQIQLSFKKEEKRKKQEQKEAYNRQQKMLRIQHFGKKELENRLLKEGKEITHPSTEHTLPENNKNKSVLQRLNRLTNYLDTPQKAIKIFELVLNSNKTTRQIKKELQLT